MVKTTPKAVSREKTIQFLGFENCDSTTFSIVKKVIGNKAREFRIKDKKPLRLVLALEPGSLFCISVSEKERKIMGKGEDANIFNALDKAVKDLEKKIK